MSDLLKLAERIEAAEGPDRELDGWIYAHMRRGESYVIGNKPGRFPREPIYGERLDVMRQLSSDPEGAAQYIGAPAYTASLDAALTLVPEGWFVSKLSQAPSTLRTSVTLYPRSGNNPACGEGAAATPALALCAAALRALANKEASHD